MPQLFVSFFGGQIYWDKLRTSLTCQPVKTNIIRFLMELKVASASIIVRDLSFFPCDFLENRKG